MVACTVAVAFACAAAPVSLASPLPSPVLPRPTTTLTDPCGGAQELLKKYLSASPCVFVRGQASIQATYAGTLTRTATTSSHGFGYPGALLNIGVTPTSQVTIVLPSFSQVSATHAPVSAGTADMEFRYKQLAYVNSRRGILGGILLTYEAPTGSPGISDGAPSYQINPLLNVALNRARTIAENLSFPVTNAPASGSGRSWSVAPQAVTVWRSPGGTLLALIVQHAFATGTTYLTINTAQLIARNFQVQATYGGNSALVDYVNPVEDAAPTRAVAYSRSFTIGVSYLIGSSESPVR